VLTLTENQRHEDRTQQMPIKHWQGCETLESSAWWLWWKTDLRQCAKLLFIKAGLKACDVILIIHCQVKDLT